VLAVRWYLHAPRGALSYLQRSWEELEGRFLGGPMAYLDAKARENSSLVRHEAPRRIPGTAGKNSEEDSWA
jgi:hypothetical protein